MRLPRWTVYPALAVLAVFLIPAVPKKRASLVAPPSSASVPSSNTPSSAASNLSPNAASSTSSTSSPSNAAGPSKFPRVVVLGIDGMDPDVLRDVLVKYPERMTAFRKLVDEGGLNALGTSTPPQSPVAWSNFITGSDPSTHGIYDFIHRDLTTRAPTASTTRSEMPTNVPLVGGWQFPIGGNSDSNRTGKPFWTTLADHGVPAFIWRMPANFPVEPSKGLSFSGMMTPAIDSAYGQCTLWTTDPPPSSFGSESKIVPISEYDGRIDTFLTGPDNPFHKDGGKVRTSLRIRVDRSAGALESGDGAPTGAASIEIGGRVLVMTPGQWSDFVRVSFDLVPNVTTLHGTVRFHLKSLSPNVALYASAVNIDPLAPATPISQPHGASADVAHAIGLYYTQGMPEDVNAVKGNVLDDVEFMQQGELVHDEGVRMMDHAVDRWLAEKDGGFLFFYFSGVDLCGHMMWRHADDAHPHHDEAFARRDSSAWSRRAGSTWHDVISDLYLRMDPVLARLRERLPADTTLIVMSDHGFESYRRKFSLNTWLVEHGYLVLRDGRAKELPESDPKFAPVTIYKAGVTQPDGSVVVESAVDWTKTRAYGVGFNALYLNLAGREKDDPDTTADESGIVKPGAEADALLDRIKRELEAELDGEAHVVLRCDLARDVYRGARRAEAPDMVVGYNANYGNSDESSTGRIPHAVLEDNMGGTFNGSHLMSPDVVPGVLLSNRKAREGAHRLEDLTVEILKQYGIAPGPDMHGAPVLR